MDHPDLAVTNFMENSIVLKRVSITAEAIHHLLLIQVGQMSITDNYIYHMTSRLGVKYALKSIDH